MDRWIFWHQISATSRAFYAGSKMEMLWNVFIRPVRCQPTSKVRAGSEQECCAGLRTATMKQPVFQPYVTGFEGPRNELVEAAHRICGLTRICARGL